MDNSTRDVEIGGGGCCVTALQREYCESNPGSLLSANVQGKIVSGFNPGASLDRSAGTQRGVGHDLVRWNGTAIDMLLGLVAMSVFLYMAPASLGSGDIRPVDAKWWRVVRVLVFAEILLLVIALFFLCVAMMNVHAIKFPRSAQPRRLCTASLELCASGAAGLHRCKPCCCRPPKGDSSCLQHLRRRTV